MAPLLAPQGDAFFQSFEQVTQRPSRNDVSRRVFSNSRFLQSRRPHDALNRFAPRRSVNFYTSPAETLIATPMQEQALIVNTFAAPDPTPPAPAAPRIATAGVCVRR